MKILITGAAGFLGSHLSEKYVLDKHVVYGVDNLMNGNLNNVRTLLHKKNFASIIHRLAGLSMMPWRYGRRRQVY